MGNTSRPRRGSLQYWPRKRANKILPSVNWRGVGGKNDSKKLMGFIGYKVGMKSAFVKDITPDSMTKNKRIAIPVTIIECPPLKIFSVRFYKNNLAVSDILSSNLDKELKKKVKLPKQVEKTIDSVTDFDDIRLIVYSVVKKTTVKKKPDIVEISLGGSKEEKLAFVKEYVGKELKISDFFDTMQLVDVRGVTKGKGTQGPVKRFGIALRSHKAEKGLRKVGSIGPWHPAHVSFRVPMAGQLGMFTRAAYNSKIVNMGKTEEISINPKEGFKKYGNVKTDYIILSGSIMGPSKRPVVITQPLRAQKRQEKKNFEFIELK